MPETITLKPIFRRVIVGESDGPQGADGVPELARTAYAALAAGEWEADASAPSMPVHEYDRARPSGDAWKAVWGYDARARTERGACGAVCYTFAIPADAVDQTTHGACSLEALTLTVRGDRYLDAGAIVAAIPSASATPPAWADVLAAAIASDPVCATSDQLDAKGAPLAPNRREGESADVALAVGAVPSAFVHVVLRLADYLGVRGAWIEGGAMLVAGSVAATFSRDVEPDPAEPLATLRSFFDPAKVKQFGAAEFDDLRPENFASWVCRYIFCSNPRHVWTGADLDTRLRVADERLRMPSQQRLMDAMVETVGSSVVLRDNRAALVTSSVASAAYGYQESEEAVAELDGSSNVTVMRECARVGYVAIEGDWGAETVSSVVFDAPVAPARCDAIVAAYRVAGRTALANNKETVPAAEYKPIVPTAAAFTDDMAHYGGAASMHVYGSWHIPRLTTGYKMLALLHVDGWDGDNGPDPHVIPLQPLFTARVPKGASVAAFNFDAPVQAPGWGTLAVFVTPALCPGADFGIQAWAPATAQLF